MVVPLAMAATLSLKYTRKMISRGPEPMDRAASMSPGSVSASALSTCLEKKGTVPIIRGTMAPGTLMAVPMMALDRGMTHVSKIMNGMERKKLISLSRIW